MIRPIGRVHYLLRLASQASKIDRLLGSIEVNAIPIPLSFRE